MYDRSFWGTVHLTYRIQGKCHKQLDRSTHIHECSSKPYSIQAVESVEIVESSRRGNGSVWVVHTPHHGPPHTRACSLISNSRCEPHTTHSSNTRTACDIGTSPLWTRNMFTAHNSDTKDSDGE